MPLPRHLFQAELVAEDVDAAVQDRSGDDEGDEGHPAMGNPATEKPVIKPASSEQPCQDQRTDYEKIGRASGRARV